MLSKYSYCGVPFMATPLSVCELSTHVVQALTLHHEDKRYNKT